MNRVFWLATIGVVLLHGQLQCCRCIDVYFLKFIFLNSFPHLIEKLIIMNAPHPVSFRRELSLKQMQRSWFELYFF
jgi:hypothetical protein